MLRRALTYQLIFAVAVGPLLCCCTAGRLLAAPAPLLVGSAATTTTPAVPRSTGSCCAQKHKSEKPSPDRDHGGQKPAPSKPGDKCPCKDDPSKTDSAQAATLSADVSTFLRTLTFDLAALFETAEGAFRLIQCDRSFDDSRGPNAPLVSTADLLFAHHKLRC